MSANRVSVPPNLNKNIVTAVLVLAVLILLSVAFVILDGDGSHETLTTEEQMMRNFPFSWRMAGAGAALAFVLGAGVAMATKPKEAKGQQAVLGESQQAQHAVISEQARREYVLEVIGLGATLDKHRQGKLWDALLRGGPYASIREQDKEKYPWSADDKLGLTGLRCGDTLENGAKATPMYWGVPSLYAGSPVTRGRISATNPMEGVVAEAQSSGMSWHLFVSGPWLLEERPDRLLEQVFAFFDAHPDLPYLVLAASDDMYTRDEERVPGTPRLVRDGNYIPEMPDASALFVLARRERVDALRPFVWDDPNNDFVQNKLRWMYGLLMEAVPHRDRKVVVRTPAQVGADMSHDDKIDPVQRAPAVNEWLEAAAAFAQRPDVRGSNIISFLDDVNPWAHNPPKEWKPTPWFPIPWNREQLAAFDRLPTLGFIHRPTFVKFTDKDGHPLTRRDDRAKALQAGWQEALLTLPETDRKAAPTRVIAATGGSADQLVTLHSVLRQHHVNGGADLTDADSRALIDTDRRLGNTGAATLFMQMAIGVMGSYRAGGVSVAINMRDKNEASIVMISPPSEEKRASQKHPGGGDVFAHRVTPMYDPASYH